MDIFDEEILNFWKALEEFNVKYIMVGYAISARSITLSEMSSICEAKVGIYEFSASRIKKNNPDID